MQVTGIEVIKQKERGLGQPRTDVQRLASHYDLSEAEAEQLLQDYPELLPARGTGLVRGTAAATVPSTGVPVHVPAGERLELTYDDILRITVSLEYRGAGMRKTLYGAIGEVKPVIGFDEIIHGRGDLDLPESLTEFVPVSATVDIPITADISPGTDYDLMVKVEEYPENEDRVEDVIDIVGVAPEFELIEHIIYPQAYLWEGDAEVATISFTLGPEQIPGTRWLAEQLADSFANQVREEGNTVLELKLYEDISGAVVTRYQVEVAATVAPEGEGVTTAVGVAPWLAAALVAIPWKAVWLAVIGIIAIVVLWWATTSIMRMVYKPPSLTDEVIDELPREDLIEMIIYKAPRVDYEVTREELEGMTDDGLRALLKELRDRQGPVERVPWWPIAAIGGVAVVGIGAVMATRKE